MEKTRLESLPEDCLAHIMSFTSPRDACQSSTVSSLFREAANSDHIWQKFLSSDCLEIVSKSVSPVEFSSMKDLFRQLSSNPLLIDGGNKTFSIDKHTNKKCYVLSARELSITWATNSLYWCWKPLLQSRFPEAVELIMVNWLEILGKINTQMLSPHTTYGAYLIIQLAERAFGLDTLPFELSVEVGNYKTRGTLCLKREKYNRPEILGTGEKGMLCTRGDGWLEVELGEFFTDGSEKEVKMGFREIKGERLKGGLLVEGIEIRPKL